MIKRLVDVCLGIVLAVLALPLVVLLAVASACIFRAWPFFVQERVGYRGRPFRILKIRSLPPCAPSEADKFVVATLTLPRFATLIRSTHLDELPQLWLVPFGRMSLVGPRPEMRFLHDDGDAEFGVMRTSVRPGCTGLWQVSRAAAGLIWDTTEYDRYYVRNQTLRLDLWILARTITIMTPFASMLSLDDVPRWTRPSRRTTWSSDPVYPTGSARTGPRLEAPVGRGVAVPSTSVAHAQPPGRPGPTY